jgi:hypothetical protein
MHICIISLPRIPIGPPRGHSMLKQCGEQYLGPTATRERTVPFQKGVSGNSRRSQKPGEKRLVNRHRSVEVKATLPERLSGG